MRPELLTLMTLIFFLSDLNAALVEERPVDARLDFSNQEQNYRLPGDFSFSAEKGLVFVRRQLQSEPTMDNFVISTLSLNGNIVSEYPLQEGFMIDNFAYVSGLNLLAVNTSRKRPDPSVYDSMPGSDREWEKRLIMVTPEGEFAGYGLPPKRLENKLDPMQLHFQQIISVGPRTFVVIWGQDQDFANVKVSIQEVGIYPEGNNWRFRFKSRAIVEKFVLEQENDFLIRFPQQLIAQPVGDSRLFILGQCEYDRLEVFSDRSSDLRRKMGTLKLTLPGAEKPTIPFSNWRAGATAVAQKTGTPMSDWDKRNFFYHHFSRATCLAPMDDGLVATYEVPNPENHWYGGMKKGVPAFNLKVQRLDTKGGLIDETQTFSQAFGLGVVNDTLYLFQEKGIDDSAHKILAIQF